MFFINSSFFFLIFVCFSFLELFLLFLRVFEAEFGLFGVVCVIWFGMFVAAFLESFIRPWYCSELLFTICFLNSDRICNTSDLNDSSDWLFTSFGLFTFVSDADCLLWPGLFTIRAFYRCLWRCSIFLWWKRTSDPRNSCSVLIWIISLRNCSSTLIVARAEYLRFLGVRGTFCFKCSFSTLL